MDIIEVPSEDEIVASNIQQFFADYSEMPGPGIRFVYRLIAPQIRELYALAKEVQDTVLQSVANPGVPRW